MSGVAKNKVVLLIVVAMLVCSVGQAWSKGTPGVKNTIHNLSTSQLVAYGGMYRSNNEDEICVFCHTPHGGTLEGPLWNHVLPSNNVGDFTHYNSASLSTYLRGLSAARIINDESLICLSCHDGSIAIDHLINFSNDVPNITFASFITDNLPIQPGFGGDPGPLTGGSTDPAEPLGPGRLDDDHPISFSYTEVLKSPEYQLNGSKQDELREVVDAETYNGEGVRFFGTDKRVECSSCHDPHVDYDFPRSPTGNADYRPFLIRPNTGSDLCLSCHDK